MQFNTLFLDPYLWKLQVGGKRLVQKARQSGAPIDGVVVSAGIPELDEAVAIIEELNEVGMAYVCFKPGTVEQIKSVIKIAAEVPDREVIVHVEGGRAGGHHSWEDLDDLLISTYGDLRKLSNITLCVGGGIGTPERAAQYLSGQWSQAYGFPLMPVDGILVGTATMADAGGHHLARGQAAAGRDHRHQPVGRAPERRRAAWHPGAASSGPTSTRSTTRRRAAVACSTRSPVTSTRSPSAATRSSPRWPTPPSRTSATSPT